MRFLNQLITVLFLSTTLGVFAQSSGEFVSFKIKNAGLTVDGAFEKFSSNVSYNASNPSTAKFKGSIEVASINTGIKMRDEHLAKEEYFHTSSFPKMEFSSTSVKVNADKTLKVSGSMTIKGVKKPVEFIVRPAVENGVQFLIGELEIDRRDFNVGENSWVMGDDVKIIIKVLVAP